MKKVISANAGHWLGFDTNPPRHSTIRDTIVDAIGEDYVGDYDLEAIEREYRETVSASLPKGASLHGEQIVCRVDRVDEVEGWRESRIHSGDGVVPFMFWHVAERHYRGGENAGA